MNIILKVKDWLKRKRENKYLVDKLKQPVGYIYFYIIEGKTKSLTLSAIKREKFLRKFPWIIGSFSESIELTPSQEKEIVEWVQKN